MMRNINRRRFLEISAGTTAAAALGSTSAFSPLLSPTAFAAPDGLVGYWKFDEGSGTTTSDASGSGYTATLQTGATWSTGKIGSHALSLNGTPTSYADIATTVINTAQSFSVAAWVNLNSLSGFQTIVSLDGSSVSAFFYNSR